MTSALQLAALLASFVPAAASAQVGDPVPGNIPLGDLAVEIELVATLPDSGSVSRPWARPMVLRGDGIGRRFVADQNGIVYQLHADASLSVFLDLEGPTALLANQRQQGLSSFAFHPDYFDATSDGFGKFYTASSQTIPSGVPDFPVPAGAPTSHHSVIHEWDVDPGDPDAIEPASVRELLRVGEPYPDHNVGEIGFNPNAAPGHADYGLLFVAMGDGGNVCCPRPTVDPHFGGQNLGSPLGSLLRIDPLEPVGGGAYAIPGDNPFASDGDPGTLGEIWAYGLRNPHRFAWDTGGDQILLISDIGQANVEEINLGALGANYGWSEREGTFLVMHDDEDNVFPLPAGDDQLGFTYPAVQYDHDEGDNAISGGYVYRGANVPQLSGRYVFGDLVSGRVFTADAGLLDGSGQTAFEELRLFDASDATEKSLLDILGGTSRADLRFGRDDSGELYVVSKQDGSIRQVTPGRACRNGFDDDGDGYVDTADPVCNTPTRNHEDARCQDGIDNDGDGRIDFDGGESIWGSMLADADPQCVIQPWRRIEARIRGCGLGYELTLLLAGLALLKRGRARQPRLA